MDPGAGQLCSVMVYHYYYYCCYIIIVLFVSGKYTQKSIRYPKLAIKINLKSFNYELNMVIRYLRNFIGDHKLSLIWRVMIIMIMSAIRIYTSFVFNTLFNACELQGTIPSISHVGRRFCSTFVVRIYRAKCVLLANNTCVCVLL